MQAEARKVALVERRGARRRSVDVVTEGGERGVGEREDLRGGQLLARDAGRTRRGVDAEQVPVVRA